MADHTTRRATTRRARARRRIAAVGVGMEDVIDQLPDGVIVVDAAGRAVLINEAGRRMSGAGGEGAATGSVPAKAGAYGLRDATTGRSLTPADTPLGRALAGETAPPVELLARPPGSAEDIWCRAAAVPRRDARGQVIGAVAIFADVTRERLLTRDLVASEERLRTVYAAMACGVIVVDAAGAVVDANAAAQQILGVSLDALRLHGLAYFRLRVASVDGAPPLGPTEPLHILRLRATDPIRGVAIAYAHPDGGERHVHLDIMPILDETGAPARIVLSFIDITARVRAEEALRASEERLRTLVTRLPVILFALDADGVFTLSDGAGLAPLGVAPGQLVGHAYRDVHAAQPEIVEHLGRALAGEEVAFLNRVEGRTLDARAIPLRDARGRVTGVIGVSVDVTDRVRAEEALRASAASLAEAQRIAHLGDWDLDLTTRELRWSDEIYRIVGVAPGAFAPTPEHLLGVVHPDDRAGLAAALTAGRPYRRDYRIRRPNGAERTLHTRAEVVRDAGGRAVRLRGTLQDITERVRAEEALRHQAWHDALTDLPNRSLLRERVAAALGDPPDAPRPLALLLLDLDHFKEVNDTVGHEQGDALLRQVAARLRGMVRAGDTVARLGGDEFAVLLPGADAAGATRVAVDIRAVLDAPLRVADQVLRVGASVGIALAPAHGADGTTLLRRADMAMDTAKRGRRGQALYEPAQDRHSPERLARIGALRAAIERGALALHYQPQVDLASGRVCGVEALVRWPHPDPGQGLIPPDQFIPLAEQTGLIAPLTDWVLAEAIRQARVWQRAGLLLAVSVNLSMWNLHDPALPARVAGLLREHGLSSAWLRLELTESALMADTDRTLDVLARLSALGLRLAVDDFGSGYSSLAYLKTLPVDALKIDKGFVHEMATDATDTAIVASTVALGHALGLRVVAEGIEDRATWELLAGMGCDVAQGYHIARPLPPDALERWLHEAPWAVA